MPPKAENIRSQNRLPPNSQPFDARAVLQWLAQPRLTGSEAAAETTAKIREHFVSLGYEVRDYPFMMSTWPGRYGLTAAGAVYLVGSILAAALLFNAHPGVSLVVQLLVLFVVAAIAVMARPAINMLPWGRVEGRNLIAHAPGKRPRYYLMAHRDSKSQPIPLAFRGPAIVLAILAWGALAIAALAALIDPVYRRSEVAVILGAIAAVAGVILVFCWVDNRSPGALDNGSGVAALLGVAERELQAGDVAFIVTDAEELGLAGARAIAPVLPPSFGVINIDGLDDHGGYFVLERFGWPKKRGTAAPLAAALMSAADTLNAPIRRRDVPLGLMLDHLPVVRAGTPALTLMRGSLQSLRRVHRPADNLEHLTGAGVNQSVTLLSEALRILRQQS
jgi:hypothetical protein